MASSLLISISTQLHTASQLSSEKRKRSKMEAELEDQTAELDDALEEARDAKKQRFALQTEIDSLKAGSSSSLGTSE